MRISIEFFLERQPLIAVQKINDAAILIAMFFQTFTHDDIGLVRIDTDVIHLALAIVQKRIQNAM